MNNSKKSHNLVRQNEKTVQKSQKHDANLQKNSTLYFQIGLILCLLASYTALETTFAISQDHYVYSEIPEDHYEVVPEKFIIEKEIKPEKVEPIIKPKKSNKIKEVDNDVKIKKAVEEIIKIAPPTRETKVALNPNELIVNPPIEKDDFNIMAVQKVPIYPGCEKAKNNNERRKCMSDKLGKLVQRKFNGDLGSELGLSGKQKILVAFKINKNGDVEIEKVRAPHHELEKEARRVVNKIPQMEPGKNNKKPVNVSYMLPITFRVH